MLPDGLGIPEGTRNKPSDFTRQLERTETYPGIHSMFKFITQSNCKDCLKLMKFLDTSSLTKACPSPSVTPVLIRILEQNTPGGGGQGSEGAVRFHCLNTLQIYSSATDLGFLVGKVGRDRILLKCVSK